MTAPLDDVTVVELTQMVAGAHAGMILSDYGADVLKVERPGTGEIARNVEPKVGGESFYYMTSNRGKRAITLDLKSEAGKEVLLDLVSDADVFLENFTPGTVDELGVGYEDVVEQNPEIIYCSVSAFGQSGPYSDRSGIDTIVQAYAGVASLTREESGRPLRVGIPVADLSGAMHASQAILAALRHRDRTGEGEQIDVALSDCLLAFLSVRAGYTFATGEPFPSIARSHVYFVPEGIFETADGYVQVSAVTQGHYEKLCRAIDRQDLSTDPAYETIEVRRENRDELLSCLEDEFRERPTEEWIERLEELEVPHSRVNDLCTVWDDKHTQAREMLTTVETPDGGTFPTVSPPVKTTNWEPDPSRYVASLGADTEAVLQEAGYSAAEIDELRDLGVF